MWIVDGSIPKTLTTGVGCLRGLLVAAVVWVTIDIDKPDFSLLRGFDLTGLALIAVFLGCLQYALQEGPRRDWLDEETIRAAVITSAVGGSLFMWRVLYYRQPIVDLRAFLNRNFALGSFFTFMMGIGMYGTTYLVPLFLAQARGFSALQIGQTVLVVGLVQLVISPFNVYIARAMDLRLMLAIGLGMFAFSMYLTAGLTNQTGFWELLVPQAVRGVALMFCYVPANMIALGSLPQDACDRPSLNRHDDERPAAFSLEPADRGHQPRATGGTAIPRRSRQPLRVADPG